MNLRQAAEQAHEALMIVYYADDPSTHEERAKVRAAITALRAALDEPQTTHWEGCEAVHHECRKPEQEPVAWELRMGETDRVLMEITNNPKRAQDWRASLCEVVPLYYARTPRKPLTMEQLHGIREHQRLLEELGPVWAPMLYYFCQSIERAHGIGEQT